MLSSILFILDGSLKIIFAVSKIKWKIAAPRIIQWILDSESYAAIIFDLPLSVFRGYQEVFNTPLIK